MNITGSYRCMVYVGVAETMDTILFFRDLGCFFTIAHSDTLAGDITDNSDNGDELTFELLLPTSAEQQEPQQKKGNREILPE